MAEKGNQSRMINQYISEKIQNIPELQIEKEEILQAYHLAVKNLLEINTVSCPSEVYNKTGLLDEELGLMIRAGGGYPTPWTRDAAVNTMNAACFLEPEVAKNTLWAVCERVDGKLCFQMDNQSWDKIVWAWGAWKYYLATGDREFLRNAFDTIKNSLELLEQTQFSSQYGLFTGGSFFNDGITGYPKELHQEKNPSSFVGDHPDTTHIMSLSTNCLYYYAYNILEKMASILLSNTEEVQIYQEKAKSLKKAINRWLWDVEKGRYSYFLYPDGKRDTSQEANGISFAVLFELCEDKQAKEMLKNCDRSQNGMVSVWPPFEGISSIEKPLRHNNLIWPFVNGFFILAAAKHGLTEIVGEELENMAYLAVKSKGFYEIYNSQTGEPDGGWQIGMHWDSVQNQTWSATAFISSIVFGIFGITLQENSITFSPCLPLDFGAVRLKGIHFRNIELDISLSGEGNKISSITINGENKNQITFEKADSYKIEILLCKE